MIQALQLILALAILVTIHEFGHFLAARMFNTKVERFFLFFDWPFALFKKKIGDTVWGIGVLPLGGYVKIAGMIDESMDKKQLEKPIENWEFRAKPAWQRLIIMIGGVVFNILLAFIIYSCLLKKHGHSFIDNESLKHGLVFSETSKNIGFQDGDKIIAVDGENVKDFGVIWKNILLNEASKITIERGGLKNDVFLKKDDRTSLLKDNIVPFSIAFPCVIDSFLENSTLKKEGLKIGDKIISINGESVLFGSNIAQIIKPFKSQNISCSVVRFSDTLSFDFTTLEVEFPLGVMWDEGFIKIKTEKYNLGQSVVMGFKRTFTVLFDYTKQFKLIKDSPESIGGFITIGKIFPSKWDWRVFWTMTAFLSVILAVINILPIPALDGGHVMFLCYEMITGRAASKKVLEHAQVVGMIILFALIIWANGNDIVRLFK